MKRKADVKSEEMLLIALKPKETKRRLKLTLS